MICGKTPKTQARGHYVYLRTVKNTDRTPISLQLSTCHHKLFHSFNHKASTKPTFSEDS